MNNPDRLSPMTVYYLRRLLREKKTELTCNLPDQNAVIDLDDYLTQLSRGRIEDLISSKVLEHLVTLHQSLVSHSGNKTQILDIESQIYEMLSLQWNPPVDIQDKDLIRLENFSPQKCREILRHLYEMKQKYEFLIGPKIVQNYLMKSRPDRDWESVASAPCTQTVADSEREDSMSHRLTIYEKWIMAFIQTCESILAQQEKTSQKRQLDSQSNESGKNCHDSLTLTWVDVCQKVTQLVSASHNTTNRRCRDLLKQMNLLLEKSEELLASDIAITYFLESRPQHSWCQMFQISGDGKVIFQGNSWELVTNSRFSLYVQWMKEFMHRCNASTPETLN